MLKELQVRHLGVLSHADFQPSSGLNVITGESGSGKSILLAALAFVTGGARGRCTVAAGQPRARVDAVFQLSPASEVRNLLEQLGLGATDEVVLSRVLDSQGRSRCWVDGHPVPSRVLSELGSHLVQFTGQGESLELRRPAARLSLLDHAAELSSDVARLGVQARTLAAISAEADSARKLEEEAFVRLDFVRFQLGELEAAPLEEYAELERRVAQLQAQSALKRNAEKLERELELHWGESALPRLLRQLTALPESLRSELQDQLVEASELLLGAKRQLGKFVDSVDTSETEEQELLRQIAEVDRLAAKHRCTPEKLLEKRDSLQAELPLLEGASGLLASLESRRRDLDAAVRAEATRLHEQRKSAAMLLTARATAELRKIAGPAARLVVEVNEGPLLETGSSQVEILHAATEASDPVPVHLGASGGELSRILLALRLALRSSGPLIVFDEIDAGTGGRTAELIGSALHRASQLGQLLCVTHWPQVAALAESHHRVLRLDVSGSGLADASSVEPLDSSGRLAELTRMLGGNAETASFHAEALLSAGARGARKRRTPPSSHLRVA